MAQAAAVAWVQSLAWELPHSVDEQKKKNNCGGGQEGQWSRKETQDKMTQEDQIYYPDQCEIVKLIY